MMLPTEWIRSVMTRGLESVGLYLGHYHGHVVDVNDPEQLGRVRCACPELWPDDTAAPDLPWCLPAYGPGGDSHGLWWPLKVGDQVWIRCRLGRPRKPLVVGTWWPRGKAPAGMGLLKYGMVTPAGWRIMFDEAGALAEISGPDGSPLFRISPTAGLSFEGGSGFLRVSPEGRVAAGGADEVVAILAELIDALTRMTTPTAAGPQPPVNLAEFVTLAARVALVKE